MILYGFCEHLEYEPVHESWLWKYAIVSNKPTSNHIVMMASIAWQCMLQATITKPIKTMSASKSKLTTLGDFSFKWKR